MLEDRVLRSCIWGPSRRRCRLHVAHLCLKNWQVYMQKLTGAVQTRQYALLIFRGNTQLSNERSLIIIWWAFYFPSPFCQLVCFVFSLISGSRRWAGFICQSDCIGMKCLAGGKTSYRVLIRRPTSHAVWLPSVLLASVLSLPPSVSPLNAISSGFFLYLKLSLAS